MQDPSKNSRRGLLLVAALSGCGGDSQDRDSGPATETTTDAVETSSDGSSTGLELACLPGEFRCSDDALAIERCAPTGREWLATPCPSMAQCRPCDPDSESCESGVRCAGPCESADELPSSAGCSFIANRQLHLEEDVPDGLVVANPNSDATASVWLYAIAEGDKREELIEGPLMLAPLEPHIFELSTNFIMGTGSLYRNGGNYHLVSDIPVIAYHHAPYRMNRGNDSSMLLPDSALKGDYVVMSYSPHAELAGGEGLPSYFEVVALEDYTRLEWFPKVDTAGNGLPIPFVKAGDRGSLPLNRYDTIRIAASNATQEDPDLRDVSGTVIHADRPVWVVGASRCSRVPVREEPALGRCDPLQELAIPLSYWGRRYVAPASPDRCSATDPPVCGDERHYWRVYNGEPDAITVSLSPGTNAASADPKTPIVDDQFSLASRGDWIEFSVPHGKDFVLEGDGVFLPVQYLQSGHVAGESLTESTALGDPAMVQMVPVDEWLSRYVFVTGIGYNFHYLQIIRQAGTPGVTLDGVLVSSYDPVGDFAVATVAIDEGAHLIESTSPFGIIQVGYSDDPNMGCTNADGVVGTCHSSYAYPGGMKSIEVYVP